MVGKGFFEQAIKVAKQAAGQGKQVAEELAARELIRKTWDAQTLQGLLAGKVVITDEMVNETKAWIAAQGYKKPAADITLTEA